ncbi:glycosyltransferase family 2 protein [Algicella marina]|uniref:Glycosyltransferase n=1 Tax=Algicella marina TaxID=2683284 RepID=A0A6P1T546_9RHOB|nr:glycosyltransferase [Algicella marina]QHQ36840.1 glycosyltransferase [Algicella marina]
MSAAPPVSLVIVNFDREVSLALLLKSLEYQRYPNFEIILVSNLPPERRPDSPLPIRWITFTQRNISAARNIGINAAQGEIIAFCDDDAVPEYSWLGTLTRAFETPSVGSAGGFVRGRNGVAFQWKCALIDRLGRDKRIGLPDQSIRVFPASSDRALKTVGTNCAFRAKPLRDIGGFDEAFHFYLDEADVNIRLADAGWDAAMVPLAEVHHGYAEGPYRNNHRVPKTLFEIGASEAYFVNRHSPDAALDAHLASFTANQLKRLRVLFQNGLITERRLTFLIASLAEGFEEGKSRQQRLLQPAPPPNAAFAPVPRNPSPQPPVLLVARPYQPRPGIRRRAAAAAAEGREVTLIEPEYSHRNLNVRYDVQGFWVHRFGIAGFAERDAPRPLLPLAGRIKAEINRVAVQRGLDCGSL